jgi:hypothetical protein
MEADGCDAINHRAKTQAPAFRARTRKKPSGTADSVVLTTYLQPKRSGLASASLNFTLGIRAVLMTMKMLLTGSGLADCQRDQSQEAGGGHNKTGSHAELSTLATT